MTFPSTFNVMWLQTCDFNYEQVKGNQDIEINNSMITTGSFRAIQMECLCLLQRNDDQSWALIPKMQWKHRPIMEGLHRKKCVTYPMKMMNLTWQKYKSLKQVQPTYQCYIYTSWPFLSDENVLNNDEMLPR